MKNIFKKNQIIITALAIMIAIVGYLNFTGRNNDDKIADVGSNNVLDYDTYAETEGDDILDGATVVLDEDPDAVGVDLLDVVGLDPTNTSDLDVADATSETDNTAEAADISDEDATVDEVAQLEVTDTGEIVLDDEDTSTPGEAILVSTKITSSYFATAKLTREQTRARNKELLMEIVNTENIDESYKKEAFDGIMKITNMAELENATETLLQAKGFSDAVVSISEVDTAKGDAKKNNIDVIINAETVTEQQIAQVEDIVKRKTGASSLEIHIAAVVVED